MAKVEFKRREALRVLTFRFILIFYPFSISCILQKESRLSIRQGREPAADNTQMQRLTPVKSPTRARSQTATARKHMEDENV